MCVKSVRWGCGRRNKYVPGAAEIPDTDSGMNIVKIKDIWTG
jgi:hypothetical protein